jgi:hypothetical protein
LSGLSPQALLIFEVVGFPLVVAVFVVVMFRLQARSIRDHPLNNPVPGVGLGSASQITDAGSVGWPSLLAALSTVRDDPDRNDRDEGPENAVAETLGLQAPMVVGRFQPNLIYGTRHGRQVFIRLGIDETYRSGMTNRHLRQITVLRVGVSEFELLGEGGALLAERDAPQALLAVVQSLGPSSDVWDGLRVVGGPQGIVATRPVPRRVRVQFQWLYDLWLVERIADSLNAPALEPARLGRSYVVPYGLGKSAKTQ